ncbi:tRNA pseudouridine(38-40) synthase TruA [Planococcus lenghuensis]|uniref:tRNA pseudouridine synthase A n=1 Tax=Planococcus lenghuensis TaxID=2213202 RepID=A0A1Q2KUK8_9BACL|nr:tRNA pseudouridine(38-40) synthase TruA [Planococcus lenghuensis]AQQ51804.1 tRNA pseudouridine(38-40) synthase TruA [Planococcus lenghuensis]
MKRIKAVIAYDGSGFSGFQVQPNKRTVQAVLIQALGKMHKQTEFKVTASGRTDAKVHALGQVIHFDTWLAIPIARWPIAINSLLPADIRVLTAEEAADDFHARFSAAGKTYRYKWKISNIISPFTRNFCTHLPIKPDVEAMRRAARAFPGTHDFSSFCSANTPVIDKVRTVYQLELEDRGDEIHLVISGSGFLYNMVRIIAGTLLEIGMGIRSPEEAAKIIAAQDRDRAGKTAPPQGLYLEKVDYGS